MVRKVDPLPYPCQWRRDTCTAGPQFRTKTMDKVQKSSDYECYILSSWPFIIYNSTWLRGEDYFLSKSLWNLSFIPVPIRMPPRDYTCIRERKQKPHTESPNSRRPKEARQVKSEVKSVLIIFFGVMGIFKKEFVLAGQTINSAYYCDVYTATAWKRAKNSPRTLTTKEVAVVSRHSTVSHIFFHQRIIDKTNMTVVPSHPTFLCFLDW
jgi:hypothetical protein